FPPDPPTSRLCDKIIRRFCEETSPENLLEAGCAVCGALTRAALMESVDVLDDESLNLLVPSGIGMTRKVRSLALDPIEDIPGPVLDDKCSGICPKCLSTLQKGKTPTLSLANGLWIGEVPDQLKGLTYVEKLLIARVRHNRCIVR
ncbi:hypothetical protein BJ138DRAFT_969715, partial [Hygrophoropsis aurantiaca]